MGFVESFKGLPDREKRTVAKCPKCDGFHYTTTWHTGTMAVLREFCDGCKKDPAVGIWQDGRTCV
jgi:hypothetical protein